MSSEHGGCTVSFNAPLAGALPRAPAPAAPAAAAAQVPRPLVRLSCHTSQCSGTFLPGAPERMQALVDAALQLNSVRLRVLHACAACPPALAAAHAAAAVHATAPTLGSAHALIATLGLPVPAVLHSDAALDATGTASIHALLATPAAESQPYALRCGWHDCGSMAGARTAAGCRGGVSARGTTPHGAWNAPSVSLTLLDTLVLLRPLLIDHSCLASVGCSCNKGGASQPAQSARKLCRPHSAEAGCPHGVRLLRLPLTLAGASHCLCWRASEAFCGAGAAPPRHPGAAHAQHGHPSHHSLLRLQASRGRLAGSPL